MSTGKKENPIKGFINLYNPKKIKANWSRVSASPYASLKFQYKITRAIIVGLILFICWQLITIIIKYDGRSGMMTMIGRAVMVLVMVMIAAKAWGTLTPLKAALEQYENHPTKTIKTEFHEIDVAKEVDDILADFEKKQKDKKESKNEAIQ